MLTYVREGSRSYVLTPFSADVCLHLFWCQTFRQCRPRLSNDERTQARLSLPNTLALRLSCLQSQGLFIAFMLLV